MKMQVLQEAEDEFSEAIQHYEDITPGLGVRLKSEVRGVLSWIQKNPDRPRLRPRGYRRVNCTTFPYYIAYLVLPGEIFILAIAHAKRRPDYWAPRLESR